MQRDFCWYKICGGIILSNNCTWKCRKTGQDPSRPALRLPSSARGGSNSSSNRYSPYSSSSSIFNRIGSYYPDPQETADPAPSHSTTSSSTSLYDKKEVVQR
ncbi:uncharacterized protein LOC121778805 isoform X1 [Salvia splendens]|uniref:uncharacterized protein LOC121778805 isoform X1 n=1 Tax=Salvia splendens TaxID=180675 RepID=UPI001C275461|nr:uncharacterized protein LOC121778805 isoform X1 [Salvia splendens]